MIKLNLSFPSSYFSPTSFSFAIFISKHILTITIPSPSPHSSHLKCIPLFICLLLLHSSLLKFLVCVYFIQRKYFCYHWMYFFWYFGESGWLAGWQGFGMWCVWGECKRHEREKEIMMGLIFEDFLLISI